MQGKLLIFLGYAAGVGKTYAMLEKAKEEMAKGVDVVAGYLQMHERKDTLKMMEGIERLEHLKINENNVESDEFDLNMALKRKPEIILVDELAHTNPKSFKNQKRYQDVEELLQAGINVYTCVNIQHIESLADVLEGHLNVKIKERVPDYIFDKADYLKIIDVGIEELIERLENGKIYRKEVALLALNNFFKKENLEFLREVSLRKGADKIASVNNNLKECVVVCLSSAPSSEKVIRASKQIATSFHGEFYCLYVDDGKERYPQTIRKNQALAEDIGAKNVTVYGEDIKKEIIDYVNKVHASKVVVGNSVKKGFNIFRKSLIEELTCKLDNCDIYVIPNKNNEKKKKEIIKFSFTGTSIVLGLVFLALTIILGFIFYEFLNFNDASILILFLFSLFIYSLFNKSYLLGSIYSFIYIMLFNFFFTQPRFNFHMNNDSYPLMLFFAFVVSNVMTYISKLIKDKSEKAKVSSKRLELLLDFSRKMHLKNNFNDLCAEFVNLTEKSLDLKCAIYSKKQEKIKIISTNLKEAFDSAHELGIVKVCYDKKKKCGLYSKILPSSTSNSYYPISDYNGNVYGVIGIYSENKKQLSDFQENLLLTYIYDFSERIKYLLNEESLKKRSVELENEKYKSSILRSISHDLKTPLAAISGNAQILLNKDFKEEDLEMLNDIHSEANWLKDMVDNILSVSKFQEKKDLEMEVNILDEIVNSSLSHVNKFINKRKFVYENKNDLLLLKCDAHLIEKAFVNILNNAIEHTKEGDVIKILVEEVEEEVIIHFINNGEKIVSEDKDKIFELFYSTKSNQDSKRGSGVGLYITKTIVTLHDGRIYVKQDEHNVEFTIYLKKYQEEKKNV